MLKIGPWDADPQQSVQLAHIHGFRGRESDHCTLLEADMLMIDGCDDCGAAIVNGTHMGVCPFEETEPEVPFPTEADR